MTNEQAIAELQKEHDLIQSEHELDGSRFAPALLEALTMAIEALNHSEIPNSFGKDTNVPSNDTISRQAAIAHAVPLNLFGREVMMVSVSELENLPSAQPEPKSPLYYGDGYSEGKMVYDSAECPNCGYIYDEGDQVWGEPYCPHCGQALDWYVRGEQDE